jgi:3'(2'), 5'-bisphosphate nucleotidase
MSAVVDSQLLWQVSAIARQAGDRILEVYQTDFDVEHKADDSPLTRADLASHRSIVAALQALTPDWPILSEEASELPYETRRQWQRYWLVDPLDGTKEFIKRNGEFTVNIALIEAGYPSLGVVHVPVQNITFAAAEGIGAFRQVDDQTAAQIRVRSLSDGPVGVVGSRSHPSEQLAGYLNRLGAHEMIPMGSSLKFCVVAEGRADLYPRLGPTSEWDTAAAQCVVEQAGGQVTDTAMQRLRYNSKESLLNPYFLVFGDAGHDWSAYLPAGNGR